MCESRAWLGGFAVGDPPEGGVALRASRGCGAGGAVCKLCRWRGGRVARQCFLRGCPRAWTCARVEAVRLVLWFLALTPRRPPAPPWSLVFSRRSKGPHKFEGLCVGALFKMLFFLGGDSAAACFLRGRDLADSHFRPGRVYEVRPPTSCRDAPQARLALGAG